MSENKEYTAPKVDEWDLDPGGNYVSPAPHPSENPSVLATGPV